MSAAVAALAEAITKAGLITPGKRSLLHRVGFLLSTGKSDRKANIGRYLEGRKRGLGYGPKGKRRRRTGTYTGVYATGVNKAERDMDAIDALYVEIEKARGGPRSGMIPYGSRHQYGRAKFFEARAKRWGEEKSPLAQRGSRARAFLASRYRGGKGPGGRVRTGNGGIYKSAELPMTDAVDELYDAIEKAKGLIRGGSRKMTRHMDKLTDRSRSKLAGDAKTGKPNRFVRERSAATYLSTRRKGAVTGFKYVEGKGWPSLRRGGKYK